MEDKFVSSRPLSAEQKHLLDKIRNEIRRDEVKAVSFRLEDILVLTPFSEKNDIFMLMENEFSLLYAGKSCFTVLRSEAEEIAVKKQTKKKGMPTLSNIYDILMKKGNISPDSRAKLMEREISLIEYFSFSRECGLQLFNSAKEAGKSITIISSSFLPKATVEKILADCGYDGYEHLIMLNECGKIQEPADIYRIMCEKTGIGLPLTLHIGGDVTNDVEEPVKLGMKAMYLSPIVPLMVKSGRLRGFVQKQLFFDYDDTKYLVMRCAFALYAVYGFDVPQNKLPQSDFCGDDYMTGFIVLGPLSLYKDMVIETLLEADIMGAMSENKKMLKGRDDFLAMFRCHFSGHLDKLPLDGCRLPLEFYVNHCAVGDRAGVNKYLESETMIKWAETVKEPEIAPVYLKKVKKSFLSQIADRLFQPGSKIRTIIDRILSYMR